MEQTDSSLPSNLAADPVDIGVNPTPPERGYRSPIWLWVLTLTALGVVIFFQRPDPPDLKAKNEALKGLNIQPPGPDPQVIMAKVILGMRQLGPGQEVLFQGLADQLAGWVPANQMAGGASVTNPPVKRLEPYPAVDRFRTAILAGETMNAAEVGWRLDDVENGLAPESELRQDIESIRRLYGVGKKPSRADAEELGDDSDAVHGSVAPAKPDELDPAAVDGLKKRHGLFADLALSKGDARAPARVKASDEGLLLVLFMTLAVMGVLFVGFAGFVVLLIGLINLRRMAPRFVAPHPDTEFPAGGDSSGALACGAGSVWLETLCVFVLSFLAVKGIGWGIEKAAGHRDWLIYVSFALQALTALTIFWPVARGMSFERWKRESGWAAPRGVLREIGAGIVGYTAIIPLYFAMALVVVLVTFAVAQFTGAEPPVPEGNRITEIMGAGSPLMMLALLLLATVWAPTVEETVFRGALYRHLRRRWAAPLAALGSAAVFAGLHGYVVQGLFMVGTLGFMFALLREWRGSLIACVTAHALHNGIVTILIATVIALASP